MIIQKVHIPKYRWSVTLFYDVKAKDADVILDALEELHCPERTLAKAENLLMSGCEDCGLTYSCDHCRKTVIVICSASSVGEFMSTLSHEQQHLEQALCKHYGMNPYGEDIAYASGEICKAIFENAWRTMRRLFRDVGQDIVDSYGTFR